MTSVDAFPAAYLHELELFDKAYCQRPTRHDFECIILFYFIDCNYCKSNSSELLINLFYSYSYSYSYLETNMQCVAFAGVRVR